MAEAFEEAFPLYLAMGMTYKQFWEQDCSLVIPYRKAWKIQQEQQNRFAWLQGMYIYEALCDVSPVLHAFAKPGTTAHPYAEKPYEFSKPKKKAKAKENEQKMQNTFAHMQKLASLFNQSFDKRRQEERLHDNTPRKE